MGKVKNSDNCLPKNQLQRVVDLGVVDQPSQVEKESRCEIKRKRYADNKEEINRKRRNTYQKKRSLITSVERSGNCRPGILGQQSVELGAMEQASQPSYFVPALSSLLVSCGPGEQPETNRGSVPPIYVNEGACEVGPSRVLGDMDIRTMVLPQVPRCKFCGAYKFYKETIRFCCSGGEVKLADIVLPSELVALLIGSDDLSKDFRLQIRTYNNHFAFTSIGINCDRQYERRDHGIYTVRVQGQIHHFLNDLLPQDKSQKMKGVQFYFYDGQQQVQNRLASLPRMDRTVVEKMVTLMELMNPYSLFLRQASALEALDGYKIVLRSEPGLDQRTFNQPTSDEVAGIWTEAESGSTSFSKKWDIRVYTKSGSTCKVQYFFGCYDPLQYVLMFPHGQPGWHGDIGKVGRRPQGEGRISQLNVRDYQSFDEILSVETESTRPSSFCDSYVPDNDDADGSTVQHQKRSTVSCREYYAYKLQMRESDTSYILRFGRLLQQYVVDNYIKLESMRLAYYENSQKKIRQEQYRGVVDSLVAGVTDAGKIGKITYLPASFIGGRRDMRHRYLDSMALVQAYGRPDIFLTMTCNPNWPEIKNLLSPGEEAQNRPDLCARVFKAKLGIMNQMIMSGKIFGQIASLIHVVEFQKRGLPHAHFLIILSVLSKYHSCDIYDRFVCAELPDKDEDPYLYGLVVKHMMHGPCGELNPTNVCMKDGKCKSHYPKAFSDNTTHGKGNYPLYRRRSDDRIARVRGKVLDNRWVIPYNPSLLLHFNCHINVEICCDIRAVKYLYKYVHKGHDRISFGISTCNQQGSNGEINEISDFQNARWVSPVEAIWRIYGFFLFGMYPAVLQLQVHLPDFQNVRFENDSNIEQILATERNKRTMLTEFFRINASSMEARRLNLLYKDFPLYYVWDVHDRIWRKRKRSIVRGRLSVVNPVEQERYYLRVLLNNVRCPTSFNYLLTVGGLTCESFRDAAYKRGLLHNDDDMENTLEETSIFGKAPELRRLFATLVYYCRPANPRRLFEQFFENLAEDFIRDREEMQLSNTDILEKVLQGINRTLETLGANVKDYQLTSNRYMCAESERLTREMTAEKSIPIPAEDLSGLDQLNLRQQAAFDILYTKAISNLGGMYFVDGPGGTGKSFLYKVLLAHIRSKGYIGLVVASSGIASSIFLGGRTAHSRFKIPIDVTSGVKCQISFQSTEAELIRMSRIIIWDEAPMADKAVIHAVDTLLQDLCKNDSVFGGKLIVLGGDFRQVLPVVRYGSRKEQVDASIVSSGIWHQFQRIELVENMRARDDPDFVDFLMRVGNGTEPTNDKGHICIPEPMLIPYKSLDTSLEDLIAYVYPNMSLFQTDPYEMMKRTILCPTNEYVDDINSKLIERMEGDEVLYISDDRATNVFDQGDYIDYLNTLEPRGIPQHKLILKENSPIILLRNINPVEGLCNGTRLICKHLLPNVIGAVIATGQHQGKYVWIPRIPLEPSPGENKYLIPFSRRQIPVKLCFAITINKAQGQTLDYVGLYLRVPTFTHGQLYVALSRVRTGKNIKVLIIPPSLQDPGTPYTPNVVYREVLERAALM